MNTTKATTAGSTKIESIALRRVRQERLRQLAAQPGLGGPTSEHYVPRHRADVRVDSVA